MSTPLSAALAGYTLSEAAAHFAEFAATYHVIPDTFATEFNTTAAHILQVAATLHLTTLKDLLAKDTLVLRTATGAENLTARHSPELRAKIHVHRNTLLTLALGAAHVAGINTQGITDAVITLTSRTQKTDRPLTDDEIALLRTHTIVAITRPRTALAATVYALCDAGQEVRETTLVTAADVDDTTAPTMVNALGRHGLEARILPLEDFHTGVLADRLTMLTEVDAAHPIAYQPRSNEPGSAQAMTSAHGVVARFLAAVGLRQPDVTASSIRRWRIAHTYDTHGLPAAMELAGVDAALTLRLANRSIHPAHTVPAPPKVVDFSLDAYAA